MHVKGDLCRRMHDGRASVIVKEIILIVHEKLLLDILLHKKDMLHV